MLRIYVKVNPSQRAKLYNIQCTLGIKHIRFRGKFIGLVQARLFERRIENLLPRSVKKRRIECLWHSILPRSTWELINRSICIQRYTLERSGRACLGDLRKKGQLRPQNKYYKVWTTDDGPAKWSWVTRLVMVWKPQVQKHIKRRRGP